jgi:hypothetical protein
MTPTYNQMHLKVKLINNNLFSSEAAEVFSFTFLTLIILQNCFDCIYRSHASLMQQRRFRSGGRVSHSNWRYVTEYKPERWLVVHKQQLRFKPTGEVSVLRNN